MSGISKRVSGSWVSGDYGIMKTSTDTITTLPAIIYPNDTTATVGISGNTVQSSTPTPENPIMPEGTGERTGNLFDEVYSDISGTIRYRPIFVGDGTFTLSTTTPYDSGVANVFLLSGNVSSGASTSSNGAWKNHNVTAQSVDGYVTIAYRHYSGTTSPVDCQTMLNTGSTALPYEPYGYKIPISSANTTTPVYLGEVETTRKIKKLVLDGTEAFYASGSWGKPNTAVYYAAVPNAMNLSTNVAYVMCSHYVGASRNYIYDNDIECSGMTGRNSLTFRVSRQYAGTKEDFKSYLAAQYAAGTPVTVWYVLATETTAVVNEPLMKIGDYADTLSNVSIPVIAGGDTISVDTTVQPSEVTISYKGWHPVQSVHEFIGNYTIGTMQTLPISELETHTISDLQGGEWS